MSLKKPDKKSMIAIAKEKAKSFTASDMKGKLRNVLINIMSPGCKPWADMLEADQTRLAADIDKAVDEILSKAINILSTQNYPSILAKLTGVGIGNSGKLEGKLQVDRHDHHANEFFEAHGTFVNIVFAKHGRFMGGEAAPVESDQKSLLSTPKPIKKKAERDDSPKVPPARGPVLGKKVTVVKSLAKAKATPKGKKAPAEKATPEKKGLTLNGKPITPKAKADRKISGGIQAAQPQGSTTKDAARAAGEALFKKGEE
mgnify:CR=1 FL=1